MRPRRSKKPQARTRLPAAILVVPARRSGAVRVLSANLDPALVEPVAREGVEWVRAG